MRLELKLGKFLTGFLFLVLMTPQALAANFPDVPDTQKRKSDSVLKDAGTVSGYGDGTFKPDKEISRAEAAAIILKPPELQREKQPQNSHSRRSGRIMVFAHNPKRRQLRQIKRLRRQNFPPERNRKSAGINRHGSFIF